MATNAITCEACGQSNEVRQVCQLVSDKQKSGYLCKSCRELPYYPWDKVDANRERKRNASLPRSAAEIVQFADSERKKIATCKGNEPIESGLVTTMARMAIQSIFDALDSLGLHIDINRPLRTATVDQCLDVMRHVSIKLNEYASSTSKSKKGRPPQKRKYRHGDQEARETAITNVLIENNGATLKDIQRETGISPSTASRTKVWKRQQERKKAMSNPLDSATNINDASTITKSQEKHSVAPSSQSGNSSDQMTQFEIDDMDEQRHRDRDDFASMGYSDEASAEDIDNYRRNRRP